MHVLLWVYSADPGMEEHASSALGWRLVRQLYITYCGGVKWAKEAYEIF